MNDNIMVLKNIDRTARVSDTGAHLLVRLSIGFSMFDVVEQAWRCYNNSFVPGGNFSRAVVNGRDAVVATTIRGEFAVAVVPASVSYRIYRSFRVVVTRLTRWDRASAGYVPVDSVKVVRDEDERGA